MLAALAGGALALVAFLVWQTRAPEPLIPLGLFPTTAFPTLVGAMFLCGAAVPSAAFPGLAARNQGS